MADSNLLPSILLLLFGVWFPLASGETFYVTPSTSVPCPVEGVSCMTLSQYAAGSSDTFTSNATLILLPGNHSLGLELSVSNISWLMITTLSSSISLTTITCSISAKFQFEAISYVHISGVQFVGCVNNDIKTVDQFVCQGCDFNGLSREGTGLTLESVTKATILNSSFSSNTGQFVKGFLGGGAVIVDSSNVFIIHCSFDGNKVGIGRGLELGGALYAIKDSRITIKSSNFNNNYAGSWGGAVCALLCSNITILRSTFINNTGNFHGGALYTENTGFSIIENSTFIGNKAISGGGGGAVWADDTGTVIISGSTFTSNSGPDGSGLFVVNCNVTISDTNFTSNSGGYRGGGIYVIDGPMDIYDCTFVGNAVDGIGGAIYAYSYFTKLKIKTSIFSENRANISGGALYATENVGLTIQGSVFARNEAHDSGGAVYMETVTSNFIDLLFTDNFAVMGACVQCWDSELTSSGYLSAHGNIATNAAVHFVQSKVSLSGNVTISDSLGSGLFLFSTNITFSGLTTFRNNSNLKSSQSRIQEGGAITSFQSDVYFLDRVILASNEAEMGGGILATESKLYMYGDISFVYNTAFQSGGGVYAFQTEINLREGIEITGNTAMNKGGGMYVISSTLKLLEGYLNFSRNNAKLGGGLCLELNAKLYIIKTLSECRSFVLCTNPIPDKWLTVVFADNSADYGGAVYVTDDTNSGTCSAAVSTSQLVSSECFFQVLALYQNVLISDEKASILNIRNFNFTNNIARVKGMALFGGLLDRCTLSAFAEVYRKNWPYSIDGISYFLNTLTTFDQIDFNLDVGSFPVRACFCKNGIPDCLYQPQTKYIMKGQLFKVPLVAVDQINNTIPHSTIRGFLSSGKGGFNEGQSIQVTNESCTELEYNVYSPLDRDTLFIYAEGPCNNTGISQHKIELVFLPCQCPIGFQPADKPTQCECECNSDLSPFITNCSTDTQYVLREGTFWITYVNNSNGQGFVTHPHCPFDYCHPRTEKVYINFNTGDIDTQCAFNRTGVLCGSCGGDLSLSLGGSRCLQCSDNWLLLLISFAIAGVALVAFLLVCNLTVAVGTINGLIFYANIVFANRSVFFPFNKPNFLTIFIAWLNLDFGIETCFYDGMDGYAKVWLQFIFPSYIILLVVMVIIISENSTRFTKLLSYTNPVATLATLILLSYAKLLRTIIACLSFTTLQYPDGSVEGVWLYDANVRYLEGKHIFLFVIALLVLLTGVVYTFFLLFWQLLLHCPNQAVIQWMMNHHTRLYRVYVTIHKYLYSFMDVYHAPYNTRHRYWTGVLLFLRGILFIILAVNVFGNPSVNLLATSCTIVLLLLWKTTDRIYKTWHLNILDTLFIVNLGILTVTTLYLRAAGSEDKQGIVANSCNGITFIMFVGLLLYHVKHLLERKDLVTRLKATINHMMYHKAKENEYDPLVTQNSTACKESMVLSCSFTEFDALPEASRSEDIEL